MVHLRDHVTRPPQLTYSPTDANAQMALLQFMTAGIPRVRTPTSVHVDHLITAEHGAKKDLAAAIAVNKEVYDFLESACAKVRRTSSFPSTFVADPLLCTRDCSTASLSGRPALESSIRSSLSSTPIPEAS